MTLRRILKDEVVYWLPMVIATYVLINGYLSGWTSYLLPEMRVPLTLSGDGLLFGMRIQRQIEGFWYFENMRSGYPFVSNLYNFPMSFLDALTIKLIGFMTTSWYAIYIGYTVLSFVSVAITSYAVLRVFDIQRGLALVGACAFNMVPFHFYRFEHLFLIMYAGVPLVYYLAWRIWRGEVHFWRREDIVASILLGICLGAYHIYFALFNLIIVVFTTGIVALRDRSWRILVSGGVMAGVIGVGAGLGLINPLWNMVNGLGTTLIRPIEDSVSYALAPIMLFTFVLDTYISHPAYVAMTGVDINSEFYANSIFGSLGLVIVVIGTLWALLKRTVSPVLRFLGFELGLILFYCMVGGGGLIVSLLMGSIIRATNRFAIYAMFIGVLAGIWGIQLMLERLSWRKPVPYLISVGMLTFCLVYYSPIGTNPTKYAPFAARLVTWQSEQAFFRNIEVLSGSGAPTYQLPALAMPEHDPGYRQTRCMLYASLVCSHGNGTGSDGDLFYQMLAKAPVNTQLQVLSRLGFTGMILDRTDASAYRLEPKFRDVLGHDADIVSVDQQLAYYRLPKPSGAVIAGRNITDVVSTTQFLQTEYALRDNTDVHIPIDFSAPWVSGNVKNLSGLYGFDPNGGRWSSDFQRVKVTMQNPLPPQFILEITALARGSNIRDPIAVMVGNQRQYVTFEEMMSTQKVQFTTDGTANQIIIDARFIDMLFKGIRIVPQ
jgi:phosphoglycerol transferase